MPIRATERVFDDWRETLGEGTFRVKDVDPIARRYMSVNLHLGMVLASLRRLRRDGASRETTKALNTQVGFLKLQLSVLAWTLNLDEDHYEQVMDKTEALTADLVRLHNHSAAEIRAAMEEDEVRSSFWLDQMGALD